MKRAAKDLKHALVLKFLSSRPSIDVLGVQIIKTWGFSEVSMISFMDNHHVLLHLANKKNYVHVWAREGKVVAGCQFQLFNWSANFDVNKEPSIVPQWIFLPDLRLHLYRQDCLQSFAARFGRFFGTDNAMLYCMRATGARMCVEVDLQEEVVEGFSLVVGQNQGADLENFIQPSISEVIVNQLKEESIEEKVYDVLKSISIDSSPGESPQSFDKFHPINLYNVLYKAFSKILINKLSLAIGDLISEEQGAFVRGMSIFENVTLTQEMNKILHQKAAFNCLSVDEKVRSVGIPIVSACNCCSIRGIEDLDHILNKGDFASNLWRKVSAKVGVPFLSHLSWKERVQLWFNRVEVRHWNSSDDCILRNMEMQILLKKQKKIHVLRWLKPSLGTLKLNLDGSSLGNSGPADGGGILRDSAGNFIFGFSKFFGSCSNNEAELRVLVEEITICKHFGHDGIDIEFDSDVVVSWIRARICNPWYLWDFWDQLTDLFEGFDFSIRHFYSEGNKVVDALAHYGASVGIMCLHVLVSFQE
ncbi:hypothetical protein LWI28_014229 [Acer negundo]|uniref:RNase H type-1 domain-containing protein n=1 Tax=Acer negundo TaxID=4023 RepID=A0AAD5P0G7_ACENE|nr:hypothetical protein LWI28_014229 [Acer negundo]